MNWNKHSELIGSHAFLGASNYHWLSYNQEKLAERYENALAKQRGTELHEFAATCIRLRQRLPKSQKTLNQYINDAIGFKMSPEVVLFYSRNCFGTADSISFRDGILRVHDLKTGKIPGNIKQLRIYAALFCLEYGVKPEKIQIELRIYQDDGVLYEIPEPGVIQDVMNTIVRFDKCIEQIRKQEEAV